MGTKSVAFAVSVVWMIASIAAMVVGQFLPHTNGVTDVEYSGDLFTPDVYAFGSLTGWEWDWGAILIPAAVAALSVVVYLITNRRRLLLIALLMTVLATGWELFVLTDLPQECGDGFLELSCPPGRDVFREAAWGTYFTLGASLSLTLACAALVALEMRQTDTDRHRIFGQPGYRG